MRAERVPSNGTSATLGTKPEFENFKPTPRRGVPTGFRTGGEK